MVEREAQVPRERPLIASVIYNRLKEGIPLGIDATLRYETGNWKRPLRQSELDAPTPYNTRLNPGLPPGPIGNPGIESIKAAARPAPHELPVLRGQAVRRAASTRSRPRTRSTSATSPATSSAREEARRALAHELLMSARRECSDIRSGTAARRS